MSTMTTIVHKLPIASLLILFVFIQSCMETEVPSVVDETDVDMETASGLVDLYMNEAFRSSSTSGRVSDAIDSIDRAITVLKFREGELVYNTNTDTIEGYHPVIETTVTATVKPGSLIFWFAGAGIITLDSIDFDDQAIEFLDDLPSEIRGFNMWVVQVPDNFDPEHNVLKYDIVYESEEQAGVKVRLDPKVKIKGGISEIIEDVEEVVDGVTN